jgi:hypothetical protein
MQGGAPARPGMQKPGQLVTGLLTALQRASRMATRESLVIGIL